MKAIVPSNHVFCTRISIVRMVALILTFIVSLVVPSHQFSLSTMISALPIASLPQAPSCQSEIVESVPPARSVKFAVPSLQLSKADDRDINGMYIAQDPKSIPLGFIRMCAKAGGFAPRSLWDDLTNGITPWFESRNGFFVYFNCHDSRWWIDDSLAPMYYRGAQAAILVYDITFPASFVALQDWAMELKHNAAPDLMLVICGNKGDLNEFRRVDRGVGEECAHDMGAEYVETSAEDGKGVTEMFTGVAMRVPMLDVQEEYLEGDMLDLRKSTKSSQGCC